MQRIPQIITWESEPVNENQDLLSCHQSTKKLLQKFYFKMIILVNLTALVLSSGWIYNVKSNTNINNKNIWFLCHVERV